ncbi:Polynucleotide 5'-hydroxyl-kinase grc3 [Apiospora phragmitis]|uniref:Polynucleotide 5'-hydroxyl-kinase GRC3 n=1 Tax=Apiospora phragmitis TaxID=2905665 RepID=A0ABR1TWN3_9PEZI
MATNKRRKLETAEQPQVLSAFARLRQARAAAVDETPVEAPVTPTTTTTAAAATTEAESQKKVRRSRRRSPQKQTSAAATVATEEPGDSPRDDRDQDDPAGARDSRLVILGNYDVRVVSGEVTLNGALLKASTDKTHWVCAPQCYALPVLRCPDEAAIELAPHPAAESLGKMGRLSPLFRRIWNDDTVADTNGKTRQPRPTFELLFTSADGPKKATLFDLVSPPEWNRKIDELVAASRSKQVSVMVTGPKSSGKSTFGRLLTNNLLTYYTTSSKRRHAQGIVVLDLDPGQPEYCIAGQIGLVHVTEPLLGPSFCRPLPGSGVNILRSHTLASMSPASDTSLYILAAIDLFNHYRNRLGNLPLVINTAGWVQGIGLDLLTSLVDALRPTDLVYMASGPVDIVRSLQESIHQGSFTQLPSQTTQNSSRTAAQLRTMQTMSYFHAESKASNAPKVHPSWNVSPLTTVAPWQIKYSGPSRGIMGIMCYGYQTPPNLLADAINDYRACFGWGIDVERNILQILTPISEEKIEEINEKQGQVVLVSGKFDPPSWAYTEDLYYGSRTESTGDNGSGDIMEVEDDEELNPSFIEEEQQEEVDLVSTSTPWIEVLRGDEKRGAASKVWRVRRDLGRTGATGE